MSDPNEFQMTAPVRGFADIMAGGDAFAATWRLAKLLSDSGMVPKHFAGNPPGCFVALVQAIELKENPIVLMQNMFVVHGMPGFSTKYMIARANKSGIFKGRINWRVVDNGKRKIGSTEHRDLSVTAYAFLADTGEEISITVDLAMAQGEGWLKNEKYASMPEVMYRYRSAALLLRLYAPETLLSSHTAEEIEDMQEVPAGSGAWQAASAPAPARPITGRSALGLSDPAPALTDNGDQPDPLAGVRPPAREAMPVESEVVQPAARQQRREPPTAAKVNAREQSVAAVGGDAAIKAARDEAGIDYAVPVEELSQDQLVAYSAALATV